MNNRHVYSLIVVFILLSTAAIYYPGLHSRFLLDDYYNLVGLEMVEAKGYFYYLFNVSSGPSGRPVSLLSFALQHQDWPSNPFGFKLINLFIHLANGVLIFFITGRLGKNLMLNEGDVRRFSCVVMALWLLNPINISTVLYVVQRMTQLSAMFSLLGILSYLYFRDRYLQNNSVSILAVMICSIFACTVMAVFSKENGILLPLYILVLEWTLVTRRPAPKIWNISSKLVLLAPLIIFCIYLAFHFDAVLSGYQTRDFTMAERILTEARILLEYIYKIVLPNPALFSLYYDDYPKSTGFLAPITTLISIVAIFVSIVIALKAKARQPVISIGILWFFSGHLLESTYLNLELYYEHRNYLPSLGVIFIIAWLMLSLWKYGYKKIAGAMIFSYSTAVASVTAMESLLWAHPVEHVIHWQNRHPTSVRAIEDLGNVYLLRGDYEKAITTHYRILEINENDIFPYLKEISIKGCYEELSMEREEWLKIIEKAKSAKWHGVSAVAMLDSISNSIDQGKCSSIDINNLIVVVITLAFNPEFKTVRHFLHQIAAVLSVNAGDAEAALENINRALELVKKPNVYSYKVRILITFGRYKEARKALEDYKDYVNLSPKLIISNKNTIHSFEQYLSERLE